MIQETQNQVYKLRGLAVADLGAVSAGQHRDLKLYFRDNTETGCMLSADGSSINLVVTGNCDYNAASMVRYLNKRFGKQISFRDVSAGQVRRGQ